MESLVVLIIAAIGGMIFYKHKSDQNEVDATLIQTKAKDQALIEQQSDIEAAIAALDAGIEQAKKNKEAADKARVKDNLSNVERAQRIKDGLK